MNRSHNDRFVEIISPDFQAFMARADEIRWSPADIAFDRINASKLKVGDLFAVFVTLHIENYSDVYTKLLVESYDDVPLMKKFVLNWEKEEENHARVLEAYLVALGMPLDELKANYALADKAKFPVPSRDQSELNVFVFLQELFTREMYSKMLKSAQEPVLRDILKRVVRDEERHFRFYKRAFALRLQLDRRGTLAGARRIFKVFGMPQTMHRQSAMTNKLLEYFPYSGAEILSIAKAVASAIEEPSSRWFSKTPLVQWFWMNRRMLAYGLRSRYLWTHVSGWITKTLGLTTAKHSDQEYVDRSIKRLTELRQGAMNASRGSGRSEIAVHDRLAAL